MLRDILLSKTEKLSDKEIDELIDFNSDFYYAFDYFLTAVNSHRTPLNKRFRKFITAVLLLNKNKQTQLVDSQFAELLDCSRETVGRIRKRFDAWQFSENHNLVEIIEGEFIRSDDKTKTRYSQTSYKITFGRLLIEAILEARETPLYKKNSIRAIQIAIDDRLELIDQNYKTQKRKIKAQRAPDAQLITARKQLANAAQKCFELADNQENDVRFELDVDIENLYEMFYKFEDNPDRKRNPKIFKRGAIE